MKYQVLIGTWNTRFKLTFSVSVQETPHDAFLITDQLPVLFTPSSAWAFCFVHFLVSCEHLELTMAPLRQSYKPACLFFAFPSVAIWGLFNKTTGSEHQQGSQTARRYDA